MSDFFSRLLNRYGLPGIVIVVLIAILIWVVAHFTSAPGGNVKIFWGLVQYTKHKTDSPSLGSGIDKSISQDNSQRITNERPTKKPLDKTKHVSDILFVPFDVAVVYVHLQQPGPLVDGSSEIYDVVDREGLINRFEEFRAVARERKMRLMITAATAGETQWLHSKITYRGNNLKPCTFRDTSSHSNHAGVEIPLE